MKYLAGYIVGEVNPRYLVEYMPRNERIANDLLLLLMYDIGQSFAVRDIAYVENQEEVLTLLDCVQMLLLGASEPRKRTPEETKLRRQIEEQLRKNVTHNGLMVIGWLLGVNGLRIGEETHLRVMEFTKVGGGRKEPT